MGTQWYGVFRRVVVMILNMLLRLIMTVWQGEVRLEVLQMEIALRLWHHKRHKSENDYSSECD